MNATLLRDNSFEEMPIPRTNLLRTAIHPTTEQHALQHAGDAPVNMTPRDEFVLCIHRFNNKR